MKIYTATSWKNENEVLSLAKLLRSWGHEVYCFAELGSGQHLFQWSGIFSPDQYDGITCLDFDDSRLAYANDKKYLDDCDCVVLLNPCGRDAHMEAGFAKGKGKLLFIIGTFPVGEFSNMYHMADGLFRIGPVGMNALRVELSRLDALQRKTRRLECQNR